MRNAKVLFFAADPLSAAPDEAARKLALDEDLRLILEKVRAAKYRDVLKFDPRPAARADDLQQALHETRPQVVHFSGHGGSGGLVMAGPDGYTAHRLDAAALRQLFEAFRGDIRVVVLSACYSRPQAEAIAEVVGCAIGTRGSISDHAAILFNASFYRAIAFGDSVLAAFEKGRVALALHGLEAECPELLVREGVDPARIILVSPRRPAAVASAGVALTTAAVIVAVAVDIPPREWNLPLSNGVQLGDCSWSGAAAPVGLAASPAPASTAAGDASGEEADLVAAKDLCRVGNYAAAFPYLERAAKAGNPEAMGFLGIAYLSGQGTERQPDLAVTWLRRAEDAGDARGMYALGAAYEQGDGLRQSDRWAKYWYRKAAEQGYPEAMRNVARFYPEARGDSALIWLRRAVDAGSVDAMVDLGVLHEDGPAGLRDTTAALHWYRRAAQARSARGMFAIGRIYQDAVGVARDYGQARAWYLQAARVGSADAMNNLGVLYRNGWGVRRDRAQAVRWFRRAAEAGSPVARGYLATLAAR